MALTAAPLVEGAVAAAARARGGAALDEVAAEARGALRMKTSQLGEDEPEEAAAPATPAAGGQTLRLRVANRLGLHARPAARFVAAATGFDASVAVRNDTRGTGPADGRSLTALAVLGVRQGDEIVVEANGPQADAVLGALQALADDNFGDPPDDANLKRDSPPSGSAATPSPARDSPASEVRRRPAPS